MPGLKLKADNARMVAASLAATKALTELKNGSKTRASAAANLAQAKALLFQSSDIEVANEAYLSILEKSNSDPDITQHWLEFHRQWPANRTGLRFAARGLARQDRIEDAIRLIEQRFNLVSGDEKEWLNCANLLADADLVERSFQLFEQMLSAGLDSPSMRAAYAKRLKLSGLFLKADHVLEPVRATFKPGTRNHILAAELRNLADAFPAPALALGVDLRLDLMLQIVRHYAAKRQTLRPQGGLGRVCFVTGSLAMGGAEQQMARLAIALSRLKDQAQPCQLGAGTSAASAADGFNQAGSDPGLRDVSVLVRSLDTQNRQDALLETLQRANVPVHEAEQGRAHSAPRDSDPFAGFSDLNRSIIDNLPQSVARGVAQFYPVMKHARYDTVSIWQDGAVGFAGIPALMAGIPKIGILFRGLPPNIRHYLNKPEYAPLFGALAQVKGVTLAANSQAAAREYEKWLDLPPGTVRLVPNGVSPLGSAVDQADAAVWSAFLARTADVDHTIGSVGRFAHVKRPLDWIEVAAAIHRRNPRTRFVMVGDGAVLHEARSLAQKHGLTDSILFTGYSDRVGYWLSKMDVMLMLSRYEGLPNVLIEAQASGVPVVSTPAGGAVECFRDGCSGRSLPFLETIDHAAAAETVLSVLAQAKEDPNVAAIAKAHAHAHFSVSQSVNAFLQSMHHSAG